jgi:hypothetical protein
MQNTEAQQPQQQEKRSEQGPGILIPPKKLPEVPD